MGQINTNNYPTVNSLADADLLIVENATNGTGTTTPKQLRENAIGTGTLQTSAQTVTGAINELKHEIDLGAGVARYDVNTITSGYLGQFSGSANLLLLHLTTDGTADATNGYMMMLSYSRPVARFAYGRLVDADGVAYKQDVYADNTIICKISNSGTGTESDPEQVVILGIINAGFMLTPTAVVSDRDIQDGQGNTLSVLAEALTKTASGNPVVISDCAGGKARSLITSINAIQDLHGYDKPWVGGARKNKLPYDLATMKSLNTDGTWSDNVYTDGGVSFTVADGVVYLSGTSTKLVMFYLAPDIDDTLVADESYILTGAIDANIQVGISQKGFDSGSGLTFVNSFTISDPSVRINIASGINTNGKVVKPMIRLATESDASFAPYSNICPISGRSSVVVNRSDGDEISEDFTIQLGTTVYGGTLNVTTGVLTIKTKMLTFDGSDENWGGYDQTQLYGIDSNNIAELLDVKIVTPQSTNNKSGLISNLAKEDTQYSSLAKATIAISKWGNINYFYVGTGFTGGTYDLTAFKALLASTPLQVEYPLATPQTIQLTPTQLEMLKGYNRVSIDNGSIELGYIAKLT